MNTMQHIPIDLIASLRDRYGLQQFVETGTYHGQSALIATGYFDLVTTCDIDPALSGRLAHLRVPPPKRLNVICGYSPQVLFDLFSAPDCVPALVFLDAHWCGGEKFGAECPLLDELRAIGGTRGKHVILCDDARLFIGRPPPPHDPEQWPTFDEIVTLCGELGPTDSIEVVGDVIIIRPQENTDC